MHDGDHDILGSYESHGDHEHSHKRADNYDQKHDHEHNEGDTDKKKSDKMVKIIAGLVSVGLIVAFALWKLI